MMADSVEALLPCPFCGGAEVSMSFSATLTSPEPHCRFVECEECAASGPNFDIICGNDPIAQSHATIAWNTRIPDASQAQTIAALRRRVAELYGALDGYLHAVHPASQRAAADIARAALSQQENG